MSVYTCDCLCRCNCRYVLEVFQGQMIFECDSQRRRPGICGFHCQRHKCVRCLSRSCKMRSHKFSLFARRDIVVFALSVRSHSQALKLGMANKLDAPNKLGMANYIARKRKCKLAGMDRCKKARLADLQTVRSMVLLLLVGDWWLVVMIAALPIR